MIESGGVATGSGVRGGGALRATGVALALVLARAAAAQAPAPVPQAQAAPPPIDAYAEAAATTIIAEQSCPGVRLNAGALTTLRLAARIAPGQEAALEEKLRSRAGGIRQQLAADGREAWCAGVFAAFGPGGTTARGVLTR